MSIERQRPRATRYAVTTALLFRARGEDAWHSGRVVDMSVTGVAWQVTDSPPRPSTIVEFILPLAGTPGSVVRGAGRVVRTVAAARPGRATALAVAIEHSTLLPIPPPGTRSVGGSRRAGAREPQLVRHS